MLGTAISFASAMLGGLLGATVMMFYNRDMNYRLTKSNEYLRDRLRIMEYKNEDLRKQLQRDQMFSQTTMPPKSSHGKAPKLGNGGRTALEGGEWLA